MCDATVKAQTSVTLANGVFVPASDRAEAMEKIRDVTHYAATILDEKAGSQEGIIWDLIGYVHGHDEELPQQWRGVLKELGFIDDSGDIPPRLQWALVSMCCEGERLGEYAWKKQRT